MLEAKKTVFYPYNYAYTLQCSVQKCNVQNQERLKLPHTVEISPLLLLGEHDMFGVQVLALPRAALINEEIK